MSLLNIISNQWYQAWHYDPVSHLNNNNEAKPMQEYRAETKQFLPQIYNEHEVLLKNKEDGLLVRAFSKIGTILSGKYSFSDLKNDLVGEYVSPISHFDNYGNIKSHKQFREELKDHLGGMYARHQELINYDNSTYLELMLSNTGKSISDLFSGNILSSASHGTAGMIYSVAGATQLTYNILSNVTQTTINLVKSGASYLHTDQRYYEDNSNISSECLFQQDTDFFTCMDMKDPCDITQVPLIGLNDIIISDNIL